MSCKPADKAGTSGATAERSLYERLGGKDAITAVVEDFVANVSQLTKGWARA